MHSAGVLGHEVVGQVSRYGDKSGNRPTGDFVPNPEKRLSPAPAVAIFGNAEKAEVNVPTRASGMISALPESGNSATVADGRK